MPIYEYNCSKCGIFEVSQHIIEAPLSKCPHCRGKVRKLISQTSFQLKGSGWYATDYGKGNGNGKGKVKKEEARAAETSVVSESAKTETKPKETPSTAKTSSH